MPVQLSERRWKGAVTKRNQERRDGDSLELSANDLRYVEGNDERYAIKLTNRSKPPNLVQIRPSSQIAHIIFQQPKSRL